jgi:two-component system NtrC family sensor kinase
MRDEDAYKKAYSRERKARQLAERLLENKTRELYDHVLNLEAVVTKLKTTQAQLIQSEKMSSLGQLTAGIAHEINNPIAYSYSNLFCLLENITEFFKLDKIIQDHDPTEDNDATLLKKYHQLHQKIDAKHILSDTPSLLIDTIEGVERVKKIVNNLKKISYKGDNAFISFSINDCIKECIKLSSIELKYSMVINLALSDCDNIIGQPHDLSQVFINLFMNASHACESNGVLTIKTVQEQGNIIVYVQDNGKGISKENILKIFDPFYTTKPVGKGTGLGLPISHGIIEKHRGQIQVTSEINVGTCFKIILPL